MPLTRSQLLRLIRVSAFTLIAVIVVSYAAWRSLNYAKGPHIVVFSPQNGQSTTSATLTVTGQAMRVSFLALNGRAITTDEAGNFRDLVLLFPGLNRLSLTAHDQFGRNVEQEIDIVRSEQSN